MWENSTRAGAPVTGSTTLTAIGRDCRRENAASTSRRRSGYAVEHAASVDAIVDHGSECGVEVGGAGRRPGEGDRHDALERQRSHAVRKAARDLVAEAGAVRHTPHVDLPHAQRIENDLVVSSARRGRIARQVRALAQLIAARGQPVGIEDAAHQVGDRGRCRAVQAVRLPGAALVDEQEIETVADLPGAVRRAGAQDRRRLVPVRRRAAAPGPLPRPPHGPGRR